MLKDNLTEDEVVKPCLPFQRCLETNYWHDAITLFLCPLLLIQVTAVAVIAQRLLMSYLFLAHFLKAFRGAVAIISITLRHQALDCLPVQLHTL